jgi:hypothetical protein
MSFQVLFSKLILIAVAMHVRHAEASCRQFAVTGPAGKPEIDGTSSMQMLQVFNSPRVETVAAADSAMVKQPASVDSILYDRFSSGALLLMNKS